mgnify:CR=1 FL=1
MRGGFKAKAASSKRRIVSAASKRWAAVTALAASIYHAVCHVAHAAVLMIHSMVIVHEWEHIKAFFDAAWTTGIDLLA